MSRCKHVLIWLACSCVIADAPIVLFGDFTRTHCVHSSGDVLDNLPGIHVAGPRLAILLEGQAEAPTISAEAQVWGMARALLEKAKHRVVTPGAHRIC